MARSPLRRRALIRVPNQAQLKPVLEQVWIERPPPSRITELYALVTTNPYSSYLLGSITTTDRNVLNAIIELWNYRIRDVETSIDNIHDKLIASRNQIQKNKISESLTRLQKRGLIIKDKSGHNALRIRVNPFVYWKGDAGDWNETKASERSEWLSTINPDE